VRRVLAALLGALLPLALAAPATADVQYVDLCLVATISQPAYLSTDEVTVQVMIINSGTVTATGVVVRSRGDLTFDDWGDLDQSGQGIQLPPGADVTTTVHAKPNDLGDGMIQLLTATSAGPEHDPANNRVTLHAFVTEKHADLDVGVYLDADRDGVVDPGEQRKGVEVTLIGGLSGEQFTTRTDDTGVAHFPGITGGEYQWQAGLPTGWYADITQRIRVRGGTNEARIQATRNDYDALEATVSLDRTTYAADDPVHERVTLTNTGRTDVVGIVAHCGGYGAENVLFSIGWGELAPDDKAGAVVRAGETRTWEFTDRVPPQAWDYGFVLLRCDFSPSGAHDGAVAEARAAVPGGRGTVSGTLVNPAGTALPGITMRMLDRATGAERARVESDATGGFRFPTLPADVYELRPVGPWRLSEAVFEVQVMAGVDHSFNPLVLQPGPTQDDPVKPPVTPVPVVPAPQAAPVPHPAELADTGANVVELAALGALLVVLGLLLVRRRSYS
jgi:LPXTG-motif cell wall-anchored protein